MAAAALTSRGQRQADKEQQFLDVLPEPLLVGTIHSSEGFLLYLPFRTIPLNLYSGMLITDQSIDNQKMSRNNIFGQ